MVLIFPYGFPAKLYIYMRMSLPYLFSHSTEVVAYANRIMLVEQDKHFVGWLTDRSTIWVT